MQWKLENIVKHRFLFLLVALSAILLSWYFANTFTSSISDNSSSSIAHKGSPSISSEYPYSTLDIAVFVPEYECIP